MNRMGQETVRLARRLRLPLNPSSEPDMPMDKRRRPLAAALLVLLIGACLQVEAAPVDLSGLHQLSVRESRLSGTLDPSIQQAPSVVTAVWLDVDADGDLDVVGVDGALALLVWENEGHGRLTLKRPCDPALLPSETGNDRLESPYAIDISDQGDAPSIGLHGASESVVPRYSRPLTAESSVTPRSRTRSSRTPRAPPLSLRSS